MLRWRCPAHTARYYFHAVGMFANAFLGLLVLLLFFGTKAGPYSFNDGHGDRWASQRLANVFRRPVLWHARLFGLTLAYACTTLVAGGTVAHLLIVALCCRLTPMACRCGRDVPPVLHLWHGCHDRVPWYVAHNVNCQHAGLPGCNTR